MLTNEEAKNGAMFHKWKGEHDQAATRKRQISDNKRALYMVAWGQCSPAMQSKIKSSLKYELTNQECDIVWLLKEIQSVMFKFDDHSEVFLAMENARESLGTCKQEEGESVSNFLQQFQSFEHYGSTIGGDKGLVKKVVSELKDELPAKLDYTKYTTVAEYAEAVDERELETEATNDKVLKICRDRTLS